MIDLGFVKPGSTIRIPFGSYAAATGASSATTGYAVGDIQIYKDGSTTQRASTAGFTASTDFDTLTGINLVTIDLSDNTTANFYAAGSEYIVVIADVVIDTQTVRFPIARFSIGLPSAVLNTTIASVTNQTSMTLTSGPADNNALNGAIAYVHNVASAVQGSFVYITAYTGATKTVTFNAGATFTVAANDNIMILPGNANITRDAMFLQVIENSQTMLNIMRLLASTQGAKTNGGGTTTFNIRDLADTKNRAIGTVDANGNRSAVTLDLS